MHKATVIIPAYNEEKTVADVLRAVKGHPLVSEVIVTADGCSDATAARAREAGATLVIESPLNEGKGQAMERGVAAATNDVLVFLDADLQELTHDMLTRMIRPVLDDERDIVILHIDRWTDSWQKISPLIDLCGQRCMRKRVWHTVPAEYRTGFRVEIAQNFFIRRNNMRMGSVLGTGLWSMRKEAKRGLVRGIRERTLEIGECLTVFLTLLRAHRRPDHGQAL